jgi:beta-RFAP synthase
MTERMIRVQTGARLHFGLLNLGAAAGRAVEPGGRRYGGVGLMVQMPPARVAVRPARAWSADGPLAERALAFARRFAGSVAGKAAPPHHITVESAGSEHAGLGTGTQLALAVARALAGALEREELSAEELAVCVGRGKRSAVGIHGFAHGGFIVEAGKAAGDQIAPLVTRVDFPSDWRLVLAIPAPGQGLHDTAEADAFSQLQTRPPPAELSGTLCRLVLTGMLPALTEHDLKDFSAALHEFNARVGEAFAPVQGGRYASARVAELVAFIQREGVAGVGQSSWGPTVFALVADQDRAEALVGRLVALGGGGEHVLITAARNQGAMVDVVSDAG